MRSAILWIIIFKVESNFFNNFRIQWTIIFHPFLPLSFQVWVFCCVILGFFVLRIFLKFAPFSIVLNVVLNVTFISIFMAICNISVNVLNSLDCEKSIDDSQELKILIFFLVVVFFKGANPLFLFAIIIPNELLNGHCLQYHLWAFIHSVGLFIVESKA